MEAFGRIENITGKPMRWDYVDTARAGDHICYISNLDKLRTHYPKWQITKSLDDIFTEIASAWEERAATGETRVATP
jgi:CDP-paratose 2-epimerase